MIDEHGQEPSVRTVCLECGLDLGHLGLTAGNVTARDHALGEHGDRRTFFRTPVLVVPDHLPGHAAMSIPVGLYPQVITVAMRIEDVRRVTPDLRAALVERYATHEIDALATAGRFN